MKIVIGSDHGGIHLKEVLKQHLAERGIEVDDAGTYTEESCDYPDIAVKVCREITEGKADRGVLVCGTGIGMSMAANKVDGIRAALCGDVFSATMSVLTANAAHAFPPSIIIGATRRIIPSRSAGRSINPIGSFL